PPAARVNPLGREPNPPKLLRLVFHERDERAHDQRRPPARQPRQLVAERLPSSRRHHQEHIPPRRGNAADLLLRRPKAREPDPLLKELDDSARTQLPVGRGGDRSGFAGSNRLSGRGPPLSAYGEGR